MQRTFLIILLFMFTSSVGYTARAKHSDLLAADQEWIRKQMRRIGFSNSFTEESVKHYEPQSFATVVKLNLLGFLQSSGAHLTELDSKAIQKSTEFIKDNEEAFHTAEKKFMVPAEVVSSLLWIETRHGDDMGTFHIVSVYLHLLQAKRPKNLASLTKLALLKNKEVKKYKTSKEVRKLMSTRSSSKSKWAEEQLIALAQIRKKKHLDLIGLRGSYAGAFGLPQFIPSSYRDYAEALIPGATPNITKANDAIMSVANYLHKSGWQINDQEAQVAALMKYNNSSDYANGILNISEKVSKKKDF